MLSQLGREKSAVAESTIDGLLTRFSSIYARTRGCFTPPLRSGVVGTTLYVALVLAFPGRATPPRALVMNATMQPAGESAPLLRAKPATSGLAPTWTRTIGASPRPDASPRAPVSPGMDARRASSGHTTVFVRSFVPSPVARSLVPPLVLRLLTSPPPSPRPPPPSSPQARSSRRARCSRSWALASRSLPIASSSRRRPRTPRAPPRRRRTRARRRRRGSPRRRTSPPS